MDEEQKHLHAASFGAVAREYDRGRPGYPPAAIGWVLGDGPRRVLDLGAGTGKLTAALRAAGHDVVAVEPLPEMADALRAAVPGVEVLAGAAEAIPLPDASVDAVVAGQAYHWFDTARAHPEIARVLRDGGVFAPVWNYRDDRVPWVAALSGLLGSEEATRTDTSVRPVPGAAFSEPEEAEFTHEQPLDRDALIDLVRSRSHVITLPADERDALLAAVATLAREHPDLAGRDRFPLRYRTRAFRALRLPR